MRAVILITGLLLLSCGLFFGTHLPFPSAPSRAAYGQAYVYDTPDMRYRYFLGDTAFTHRPLIMLVPSAGRPASDFNELTRTLNQAHYQTLTLDLPTLERASFKTATPPTLNDFAAPLLTLMERFGEREIILVGHAFGNRVVRSAAAQNPTRVKAVILLAAGGQKPIDLTADIALKNAFNPLRTYRKRLHDIAYAFFAPGHPVVEHWRRGWYTQAAIQQGKAVINTTNTDWQAAGGVPMFIIQPLQDRIAPKQDSSDILQARFGTQVSVTLIDQAGHALLPEQPEAVARTVLDFLATLSKP